MPENVAFSEGAYIATPSIEDWNGGVAVRPHALYGLAQRGAFRHPYDLSLRGQKEGYVHRCLPSSQLVPPQVGSQTLDEILMAVAKKLQSCDVLGLNHETGEGPFLGSSLLRELFSMMEATFHAKVPSCSVFAYETTYGC